MFCVTSNESGDYYVIPVSKMDHWQEWLYSEEFVEVPDYAHYIGGFPNMIKFDNWEKI